VFHVRFRCDRRRGQILHLPTAVEALAGGGNGFRDDLWIDWNGSVVTSVAKVRERVRRPDFGHLDIEVTVDDPKAYTKLWTVTLREQFAADVELIDEICLENEKTLSI
jgi:hypothetical protein